MSQRNHIVLALIISCFVGSSAARAAFVTYTFEDLPLTTELVGGTNDNWYRGFPAGNNTGFYVVNGTGVNTTQVAGRAPSPEHETAASRQNDINFAIPLSFTETDFIMEIDLRWDNGGGTAMSLGSNTNDVNGITYFPGETSTVLLGQSANQFLLNTGTGNILVAAPGTFSVGEWVRVRTVIDWVNETASMSYQNLSDGEGAYTPVAGLQSVAFGLPMQNWKATAISNGSNRLGFALTLYGANLQVDNASFGVPEPTSLVLLAAGGVCLARRSRRNA